MIFKSKPLLPCPFCGGNAMYNVKDYKDGKPRIVFAFCHKCGANTGFKSDVDEAAEAWNRRAK